MKPRSTFFVTKKRDMSDYKMSKEINLYYNTNDLFINQMGLS